MIEKAPKVVRLTVVRPGAILAFVAALPIAAGISFAAAPRASRDSLWRLAITSQDRARLRNWREAWVLGLEQARAAGEGDTIAREGVLLDPDAGLENPALPDGDYACRTIKLGHKTAGQLAYVAYPAFRCRMAGDRFVKLSGSQRPEGHVWPFDPLRMIFLGAMALGDEPRALDYGRDADRDMLGVVERIGPKRWRLVLPQPTWESQIDVVELVPVAAGASPPAGGA